MFGYTKLMQQRMFVFLGIALLIGIGVGYGVADVRAQSQQASIITASYPLRMSDKAFPLVNPLIAYETPETNALLEYRSLKTRILNIIEAAKDASKVANVSFYYRDLNTGDWIGINQNASFYPASLLKVPVMIAYFKEAESKSSILKERITYKLIGSGDAFDSPSDLKAGISYTVNELIEKMIVDSDNGATYTLIEHIDPKVLNEVYTDIGIDHPGDDSSTYQIPTRIYALFFRVLYNATYLTTEYSQKALDLLVQTTYHEGLVAGISSKITVAHKFGEHVTSIDRKIIQGVELHDCGIVYHPERPYLLCVMTSGKTLSEATNIIKTISREVFDSVDGDTHGN